MEYQAQIKICQNCKLGFTIEPDDFRFYEKISAGWRIPPPTFCPDCRRQRRLAWRNTYNLYSRLCDLCGKSTISIYSPESDLTVYCVKCFWSDRWDPYIYGREYDFSRSFFEQYMELNRAVPKIALVNDDGIASVNCPYTHDVAFSKNCYMTFLAWRLENVMYSCMLNGGRDLCDCIGTYNFSELMYESVFIEKCYKCRFVQYSGSLTNCDFCYDCRDCSDCFMCAGLRSKKYHFRNRQHSKEEYEKILSSYALHTRSGWRKAKADFLDLISAYPRRFATLVNCVNCTGNDLIRSKHTRDSFFASYNEESRFVVNGTGFKNCYDCSGGGDTEYCYEAITPDHSYNNFFSIYSWKNKDVAYVENCHSCSHIFACAGLKKGEHSVLNKKYPEEEYFRLKEKIIEYARREGEYGEFFPASMSHFGYNETEACTLFPMEKEKALLKGFRWQDNLQRTMGKETLAQKSVPDSIYDVSESILQEVLTCETCSRNFKIVEAELQFYKKMGVPIPRLCFFCRNNARILARNPFKLWRRKCMKEGCQNEFETSYAPERPEVVYCEKCYQREVY